jgi:hypothetical protein
MPADLSEKETAEDLTGLCEASEQPVMQISTASEVIKTKGCTKKPAVFCFLFLAFRFVKAIFYLPKFGCIGLFSLRILHKAI